MHELLGAFDAAHADYLQALTLVRDQHDPAAEWQSLLDLGWLWTGRDYQRAGEYFQQAVERARTMDAPAALAQTLNRIGNWYVHAEQPRAGLRYHREALALAQAAGDRSLEAATLDLLGISCYMGGDMIEGTTFYQQAIALLRERGDRQGLSSSLAPFATRGVSYMHDTIVQPGVDPELCRQQAEEAVTLARQIDWPAGEAHALMFLGLDLGPRGHYGRALEAAHACIEIATRIEHGVWLTGGGFTLGALYLDLLALPAARQATEQALHRAQAIGSKFLIAAATAFLAATCVAQADLARAAAVLDAALDRDAPMETLAQRLVWRSRVELALAQADYATALRDVDRMIASAIPAASGQVIPGLWYLRGLALAGLDRGAEAEAVLEAVVARARDDRRLALLWRALAALGRIYGQRGQREQVARVCEEAQTIVDDLAAQVPDAELRETFARGVAAAMPQVAPLSPRRAAKLAFDGLTSRECEVAILIAAGLSNRALADKLVLSERTVAKHVENILSKLAFTSRAQVAAWVVEKRLNQPSA